MDTQTQRHIANAHRQAARAAKQGDHAAAERWSKTAERLAAAAATVSTTIGEEETARRCSQAEGEDIVINLFVQAAFIAHAMVHSPTQAPAAFLGLIKLWREDNLGEGAEDAEAAAARIAASKAAFLEQRFEDSLPEYVRERMAEDWRARRATLAEEPVIPHFWSQEEAG